MTVEQQEVSLQVLKGRIKKILQQLEDVKQLPFYQQEQKRLELAASLAPLARQLGVSEEKFSDINTLLEWITVQLSSRERREQETTTLTDSIKD